MGKKSYVPPMTCQEADWHDPPFCGNPTCQYRPGPHCDQKHDEPRCQDADCHLICARIRHPRTYHSSWGSCPDPNCVDIRGFDQYVAGVREATTIRQVWDNLSSVISHGAPGPAAESQRKRFHREMVLLKKELAETMKDRAIEFINRWRTAHPPGEE